MMGGSGSEVQFGFRFFVGVFRGKATDRVQSANLFYAIVVKFDTRQGVRGINWQARPE